MCSVSSSSFDREYQIKELYEVSVVPLGMFCQKMLPTQDESVLSMSVGRLYGGRLLDPSDVAKRITQLRNADPMARLFGLHDLWLVAETMGELFQVCSKDLFWRFKKRADTPARRSFIIDPRQQICVIFQKEQLGAGRFKKAKSSTVVPFNPTCGCFQLACKVNQTQKINGFVDKQETQSRYTRYLKELQITTQYPCFPYVVAAFQYEKRVNTQSGVDVIPKVCVIEELMRDGSTILFHQLQDFAQYHFIVQLLDSVALLGDRIHGDLKPSNVLFALGPRGDVVVKLTDGGSSCIPKMGEKNDSMVVGQYGSVFCTAPEVLEGDPSRVDWKKAEAWALGCCLYFWLTGKEVPWGEYLCKAFDDGQKPDVQSLKTKIELFVQKGKTALQAKPRTVRNLISAVCLDFLCVDPARRRTVEDARRLWPER